MNVSTKHADLPNLPEVLVAGNKYSVKLASTTQDIEAALKLRFDVFNIELGEGLSSSFHTEMDQDEFDEQCDHLLVIDNSSDQIVGTYRMQNSSMAAAGNGFYTNLEYDLTQFPGQILNDSVELGRACIHINHRNGRVLYLLWRGIAKYIQLSDKRFLFGCCSVTSQDPGEGKAFFEHFRNNNYMHPNYLIPVQPVYDCLGKAESEIHHTEIKIPQLFRLYLDLGSKVCSPPALDTQFKTIDFLILLDIKGLSENSKALFFR